MDTQKLINKLREQDFGPEDSIIASSIMHPTEAAKRAVDWFAGQINTASNRPDPYDNPNPLQGYTPEQQAGGALNLAGMVQTGALPIAPMTRGGTLGSIAVSHGSPHKFDKFNLSKIGSGEGSQAYGHGLYFAEGFDSPVANTYSQIANRGGSTQYGLSKEGRDLRSLDSIIRVAAMQHTGGDLDALAKLIEKHPKAFTNPEALISRIGEYENNLAPAYMYNAELRWPDAAREAADPLGPHHMLDWDKPLSEQSEFVKNLFSKSDVARGILQGKRKILDPNDAYTKGESAYGDLVNAMNEGYVKRAGSFLNGAAIPASEHLRDLGIPGIKYLDQGSRGAGQGTSNYVIFDDQIPKIVSRNGQLVEALRDVQPKKASLEDLIGNAEKRGVILDVYPKDKSIELSRIVVPKDQRGSGIGSDILNQLARLADEEGKMMTLTPSDDFGASSVGRLKDFYKRFGFVENKGKNKDFSISNSMYRPISEALKKEP